MKPTWRRNRALRGIAISLLSVIITCVVPAAMTCVSDGRNDDACARCWCKRVPGTDTLRAPCPCCQPSGTGPMALMSTGILPAIAPLSAEQFSGMPLASAVRLALFVQPTPHPPPRTPALF